MRELTLVGLTTDGQQLLFADDTGEEYTAAANDKLRTVLRGDPARIGQLESDMDSPMRPRDIQARIRSGATAEEVADAASVPVEKVLAYCLPVLAERQHMAELARRSHVRRRSADGPARRLFDVVAEQLRMRNVDPDWVSWDAWRRDDGRWGVQASYRLDDSVRVAMFAYDAAGRYNVALDDEARELIGEAAVSRNLTDLRPTGRGGERRLAAVPDGGDLADSPVDDDLTAVVRAIAGPDEVNAPPTPPLSPAPEVSDDASPQVTVDPDGYPRPDVGPDVASVEEPDAEQAGASGTEPPSAASPAGSSGGTVEESPVPPAERRRRAAKRASVPSWDEIMLGGGGADDAAT